MAPGIEDPSCTYSLASQLPPHPVHFPEHLEDPNPTWLYTGESQFLLKGFIIPVVLASLTRKRVSEMDIPTLIMGWSTHEDPPLLPLRFW